MESGTQIQLDQELQKNVSERALALFNAHADWATFFREILGVDGLLRKTFTSRETLAAYERTEGYAEIQLMLARLREKASGENDKQPIRVITVRLPKSLHESLKTEAFERHTSMNQLCISKLLQTLTVDPPKD